MYLAIALALSFFAAALVAYDCLTRDVTTEGEDSREWDLLS